MTPSRLSALLDSTAEALFFNRPLAPARRIAIARQIAARQGLPGAYAGMFASTAADTHGIRLFTGEPVRTRAGISHLLGEEACRVLTLLEVDAQPVRTALVRAIKGMSARLEAESQRGYYTGGFYCCGTCSAGYWRNLALDLFPHSEKRLRRGLAELKLLRRPDGTWRRFPFYFTSLALAEIGPNLARAEMQHAATRWRRLLLRLEKAHDRNSRRRAEVGRRLLKLCES